METCPSQNLLQLASGFRQKVYSVKIKWSLTQLNPNPKIFGESPYEEIQGYIYITIVLYSMSTLITHVDVTFLNLFSIFSPFL